MKKDIQIHPATADDAEAGAELIYATMGTMADYLLGNDEADEAKRILALLFQRRENRYSHQYIDLAIIDGEIAGLLLSYPGAVLKIPGISHGAEHVRRP